MRGPGEVQQHDPEGLELKGGEGKVCADNFVQGGHQGKQHENAIQANQARHLVSRAKSVNLCVIIKRE